MNVIKRIAQIVFVSVLGIVVQSVTHAGSAQAACGFTSGNGGSPASITIHAQYSDGSPVYGINVDLNEVSGARSIWYMPGGSFSSDTSGVRLGATGDTCGGAGTIQLGYGTTTTAGNGWVVACHQYFSGYYGGYSNSNPSTFSLSNADVPSGRNGYWTYNGNFNVANGYNTDVYLTWTDVAVAPAQTTVAGFVHKIDGSPVAGAVLTSNGGSVYATTASNGYYSFNMNTGAGYSMIVNQNSIGSTGYVIKADQYTYNAYYPNYTSYQWQYAGWDCYQYGAEGATGCGDRNSAWGYDINGDSAQNFTIGFRPWGAVDTATCSFINGWSLDGDNYNASNTVYTFYNGTATTGTFGSAVTTNQAYPGGPFGTGGNHGFQIPTPAAYQDGSAHSVSVYGISSRGSTLSDQGSINSSPEGRVERYYYGILGHDADQAGMEYWANMLNGPHNDSWIASGFINSAEFNNGAVSNSAFVNKMYNNALGRAADSAGYNYWLGQLNGGTPRADMAVNFINSAEAVGNLQPRVDTILARYYGVLLGTKNFGPCVVAPTTPVINVTTSASPSGTVRPGDTITYTVTMTNTGTDATQAIVENFIPWNIDPATVTLSAPGLACTNTQNASATYINYTCGLALMAANFSGSQQLVIPTAGAPSGPMTPPTVYINFQKFVSSSSYTFTWSGRVKAANQVGIYPVGSGLGFCKSGVTDWTSAANCADPTNTNALQSVISFARGSYNWGFAYPANFGGWVNSAVLSNPVPTQFTLSKIGTGNANGFTNNENKTFTISASMAGPTTSYQVLDGPVLSGGSHAIYQASSASPAITYPGAGYAQQGANCTDCSLYWGYTSAASGTYQYNYVLTGGAGSSVTNIAYIVYNDNSVAGHPQAIISYPLPLSYLQVDTPYLTTTLGDVHAGGGTGQNCNTLPATNTISGGAGSKATYTLSAGGVINNFGSNNNPTGTSLTLSPSSSAANDYGLVCRPDLVASADKFTATAANVVTYAGTSAANQSSYNNKVAKSAAVTPITVPASSLTGRWTLYAAGDVYITGNLTYAATSDFASLPSFGIITKGNIYIDPSVTQLDGFYYAYPGGAAGTINTCAKIVGGVVQSLGTGLTVANCNGKLTVNGLMMAQTFKFTRTYAPGGNNDTNSSEQVNLYGQLFAKTPPAFSDFSAAFYRPRFTGDIAPKF